VAAVFTLGGDLDLAPLFGHRFHRRLALLQPLGFFQNPCELASDPFSDLPPLPLAAPREEAPAAPVEAPSITPSSDQAAPTPLESLRQLVAQRTELPLAAIADDHRFLRDLHLNSITVGQLVSQAAQHLGLQAPADPTAFADASLAEVAAALTDLGTLAPQPGDDPFPPGATPWVRAFIWDWQHEEAIERAVPPGAAVPSAGTWEVLNLTTDPVPEAFQGTWPSPPGRGLLVILPRERSEAALTGLLAAGQRVLADDSMETFVVLHAGWVWSAHPLPAVLVGR
jgi:enediyne polyketide synthase